MTQIRTNSFKCTAQTMKVGEIGVVEVIEEHTISYFLHTLQLRTENCQLITPYTAVDSSPAQKSK